MPTSRSIAPFVPALSAARALMRHTQLTADEIAREAMKIAAEICVFTNDQLTRVGTTCALCHSTVDNSFAPGIGRRLDGWPNLDLDPGRIIALSPAVAAKAGVYNSWGPGMYDPRFNLDGINGPVVIPPAYGPAFQKLIPGSRLEIIADCGHAPQIEKADELATMVTKFIETN